MPAGQVWQLTYYCRRERLYLPPVRCSHARFRSVSYQTQRAGETSDLPACTTTRLVTRWCTEVAIQVLGSETESGQRERCAWSILDSRNCNSAVAPVAPRFPPVVTGKSGVRSRALTLYLMSALAADLDNRQVPCPNCRADRSPPR